MRVKIRDNMSTFYQRAERFMQIHRVLENLKDVLSVELGEKKVFDKDVAKALGISKESLSHLKRRNAVPYEAIVYFCAKRAILLTPEYPYTLAGEYPYSETGKLSKGKSIT